MLPQENPVINEVKETTFQLSADKKQRMIAYFQDKAERDWCALMNEKLKEGRAEGRAEGRTEGRTDVAINLVRRNFPHDEIVQLTGLPLQEIIRLSKTVSDIMRYIKHILNVDKPMLG